ncbi:SDR family NAD(P)-dependent oxidoreductase [Micromonospora sp. 067-2]|uniref:SDR family NAD(P)-dependent oxidoreductase n=1 Tax=Micromonospora sp. 067-2 TaxID=2789270 RepID=UPI003979C8E3
MQRVFLITGSSRGLGRELARAALAAGNLVVATARDSTAVQDLADAHPDTARAITLDVTDPQAAEAAVQVAVRDFGRLDVLINNAGYANVASIEDTSLADFRAQVETNLWGAVNVTKAALPVLRQQRGGHVVQLSSVSGRLAPAAGLGAYVTAKFALEGFSEALAVEVAPFGVRVSIVEPGAMATTLATSMTLPEPEAHYAEALAPMLNLYGGPQAGQYGTDPARAAALIPGLLDLPEPPLWFPLSADALHYIRAGEQRKLAELDRWADLSRSVNA